MITYTSTQGAPPVMGWTATTQATTTAMTKTVQLATEDVFTAIAHPVRRRLLDLLVGGEQPVNRLAMPFKMSRPAISQHLRILLDVGLVSERRSGRERRYRLHPEGLRQIREWLATYDRFWQERLAALGDHLDKENRQ